MVDGGIGRKAPLERLPDKGNFPSSRVEESGSRFVLLGVFWGDAANVLNSLSSRNLTRACTKDIPQHILQQDAYIAHVIHTLVKRVTVANVYYRSWTA